MRFFTGDYLYFSFDLTAIPLVGGKMTPIGYVLPLRGDDAGKLTRYFDSGVGIGLDASGSLNVGKALLRGPISEITLKNFAGNRWAADVGFGPATIGGFYSPPSPGSNHNGVFGINAGLGFGVPLFNGNVNYGSTWLGNP